MWDSCRCMHGIVVVCISIQKVDSFEHAMYKMQGILRESDLFVSRSFGNLKITHNQKQEKEN